MCAVSPPEDSSSTGLLRRSLRIATLAKGEQVPMVLSTGGRPGKYTELKTEGDKLGKPLDLYCSKLKQWWWATKPA